MSLQPDGQLSSYIIKDRIARGGMGDVWRAWDLKREEYVAIKAIADDFIADANFTIRFLDEARRHGKLQHPNIVPVLDVFQADGQNCLVMKLIDGISLADLLDGQPHHRLETAASISIVQDILRALNFAHRQGIIHRDVKPSNVLLDKDNRAHLIDFGIAVAIGEDRRTRTGQAVGTPLYMSPEQIVRPGSIDHRSDVYSVGCVFYEMLTGRPPFIADSETEGDTDFAIKSAHVNTKPTPPSERIPGIPGRVDRLVMLALEKKPEQRLPGCEEFLRLSNEVEKRSASAGRRRVYMTLVIVGLAFLLLLSIWIVN